MTTSDEVQIAADASGSRASDLSGTWKYFHQAICVAFALFALWAAGPGIPEDNFHLGIFTLVMWIMSFLVYPGRKGATWKAPEILDWGIAIALVALLAAAIYRAEEVSEKGALMIDWAAWLRLHHPGRGCACAPARPEPHPDGPHLPLSELFRF